MLGGQFVAHPGEDSVRYKIAFHNNHPMVNGLNDFDITTEQYYLLVDPGVKVLASTIIDSHDAYWLRGTNMPVAWIREWDRGRVFYCALGHTFEVLEHPIVSTMLRRAATWAHRSLSINDKQTINFN